MASNLNTSVTPSARNHLNRDRHLTLFTDTNNVGIPISLDDCDVTSVDNVLFEQLDWKEPYPQLTTNLPEKHKWRVRFPPLHFGELTIEGLT